MKFRTIIFFSIALLTISTYTKAALTDTVTVDINLDVKHTVGDISTFDRSKFVVIHADLSENDWDSGVNEISDFKDDFLDGYDVYLGRNTGGITWYLNAMVTEDPNRPGFADSLNVANLGQNVRNSYATKTTLHPYESRNDQVLCAQLHPFWPDGQQTQKGWALSQTDTESEPLGTATGEYMAHFIKDFYGTGGTSGELRPNLVEVVNEPLWDLVTNGNEPPENIFRFHSTVAKEIKKLNDNIQVGGYCAAFPDLEKDNFQRWENRWKKFMDIAGEDMDFWSVHLYDFPAFNGLKRYRKGAQMEATLDMMEHYSYLKFGKAKPFLVSEFGAQTHDYSNRWSPYRDWLHMKSANTMMLQFMSRPNLISKAINYIMLKAEWGYNASTGKTWGRRLMRKKNEPDSYSGDWVYTDMVKMFQLWSDVKGTRVDSKANNPDLICDSYVNGSKVYVIVNNLDLENSQQVKFNLLGVNNQFQSLITKQLLLVGNIPEMEENSYTEIPKSFEVAPEATLILEFSSSVDIQINETSDETKYYATDYLKPINANQNISFSINDVEMGLYGEAVLRLGIGRSLGKQLFPTVTFNGTALTIENNYRGDDQKDRTSFFGVLEVPVPYQLLQTDNNLTVKFPDDGGYVSSVALQAYKYSREIDRSGLITSSHLLKHSNIKVFPNPACTQITIQANPNEKVKKIALYTLTGSKIYSHYLENLNEPITIDWLKNGIYIVQLETKSGFYTEKLVIKKQ